MQLFFRGFLLRDVMKLQRKKNEENRAPQCRTGVSFLISYQKDCFLNSEILVPIVFINKVKNMLIV